MWSFAWQYYLIDWTVTIVWITLIRRNKGTKKVQLDYEQSNVNYWVDGRILNRMKKVKILYSRRGGERIVSVYLNEFNLLVLNVDLVTKLLISLLFFVIKYVKFNEFLLCNWNICMYSVIRKYNEYSLENSDFIFGNTSSYNGNNLNFPSNCFMFNNLQPNVKEMNVIWVKQKLIASKFY